MNEGIHETGKYRRRTARILAPSGETGKPDNPNRPPSADESDRDQWRKYIGYVPQCGLQKFTKFNPIGDPKGDEISFNARSGSSRFGEVKP
jgi:hypothetical protein